MFLEPQRRAEEHTTKRSPHPTPHTPHPQLDSETKMDTLLGTWQPSDLRTRPAGEEECPKALARRVVHGRGLHVGIRIVGLHCSSVVGDGRCLSFIGNNSTHVILSAQESNVTCYAQSAPRYKPPKRFGGSYLSSAEAAQSSMCELGWLRCTDPALVCSRPTFTIDSISK